MIAGVYRLKDECGFPIDASYDYCHDKGLTIDWMEALAYAVSQGVDGVFKMDALLKEIKMLIPDDYGDILRRWKVLLGYHLKRVDSQGEEAIYEACERILKEKLRWRNWTAQDVSTVKVGGSNPSRSAI